MERPDAASVPNPGRVLAVDDDEHLRRVVVMMLRKASYDTTEARNGVEAVRLARERTFELVVSDVQMPDMDGVEMLRTLHEIDPNLPVLLMTGAPDLTTAMKAVQYGAFDYLPKPVQGDVLLSSVARAISQCRKRRDEQLELRELRTGERLERPLPNPTTEVHTGTLLSGRYRVGRILGEGGMGAVYEAVREDLAQMRVAVKVLHPRGQANAAHVARFRREAESVAAISHPNIVRILDFQAKEGEPAYLVMELLEGVSLREAINLDGPFTQKRATFIGSQVLAALAAAHHAKIVHRDLKPDNVFLTSMAGLEDIVKVLDFGIAKPLGTTAEQKLTQTGMVLGTPAYMAPEVARGGDADPRADIYATGCLLFEVVVGRPPFESDNYNALLFAIIQSEPPSLVGLRPDLDPAFAEVVMTAMAKDPGARFQTADDMSRALSPWVTSSPSHRTTSSSAPVAFEATLLPNPAGTSDDDES